MDKEIKKTPTLSKEVSELVESANKIHLKNFDSKVWFGRCIFLSWYCERGTCTFCFRSTTKHHIKNAIDAKRSLSSVMSEALLIKACGWRIEFLTGGYGIYPFSDIVTFCKLVSQILEEKIWINLGTIDEKQMIELKPYVEGIVSSIETCEPKLHDTVCPDKNIEPYLEMMKLAKKHGFKQSMTVVIGLGEKREDYSYLKKILTEYNLERITVYALRPVSGTPFTNGPSTDDLCFWIASVRNDFPTIEIIAGTAAYRIPEISLLLKAGANAITKLPATNIFNTTLGKNVEKEVLKSKREFLSKFVWEDIDKYDFNSKIDELDLTSDEKKYVKKNILLYLKKFKKNYENMISGNEKEIKNEE
ncbi:MAG: radical SAM protein [Candidatus Woesearchaeota archaeon]|jgi:biotin synthase-like enzyme